MPHYHCPGAKAQLPGAALTLIRAVAGPKLPGGGLDLGLRPGFIQYAEFLLQDTCSAARYINRPTEAHKDPSARAAESPGSWLRSCPHDDCKTSVWGFQTLEVQCVASSLWPARHWSHSR